jgi:hypothetical protein
MQLTGEGSCKVKGSWPLHDCRLRRVRPGELQGMQDELEIQMLLGFFHFALEEDRVDPELELGHIRCSFVEFLVG